MDEMNYWRPRTDSVSNYITTINDYSKQYSNSNLSKLTNGFVRESNDIKSSKNSTIPLVVNDLIINYIPCLVINSREKKIYLESDIKHVFGLIIMSDENLLTTTAYDRSKNKGGKLIIQCLTDVIIGSKACIAMSEKGYECGRGPDCTGGSYNHGPLHVKQEHKPNDGAGGPGYSAGYGTRGEGIYGGNTYGDKLISTLHLGSGGGCNRHSHVAGEGGGAIYLECYSLDLKGSIVANGGGGGCCGSGSGGSIHIVTNTLSIQETDSYSMKAIGGRSHDYKAGVGRIRIQTEQKVADNILQLINPKPYVG